MFFQKSPAQASEYHICKIAWAVCEELNSTIDGSASGKLLSRMGVLHSTGHGNRVFKEFSKVGLAADIPETYVDIGIRHPVLKFRDVVSCLSQKGKMNLLVKDESLGVYETFWNRYEKGHAHHPIFSCPAEERRRCIPLLLHADEGTSLKKRGLMVISLQPVVGDGTSHGGKHLNFLGNSLITRFLYSAIMTKYYRKQHAGRLGKLVSLLASDLKDLFENPCNVSSLCSCNIFILLIVARKPSHKEKTILFHLQ